MTTFESFLTQVKTPKRWAKQPAQAYTLEHPYDRDCGHSRIGVGVLAANDPATFNIWYYACGCIEPKALDNFSVMADSVIEFMVARQFGSVVVDGFELREWSVLLSMDEFDTLVRRSRPTINTSLGRLTLRRGLLRSGEA